MEVGPEFGHWRGAMPKTRKAEVPPTVRDIAAAAGVAVGSVSRALNGHPGVAPVLREKILQAAHALQYTPLRRRQSRTTAALPTHSGGVRIGLICFGMEDTLVQLPVVSAAVQGVEEAVAAEGGTLMFANVPKGDRVPAFLAEGGVAGVILKGPNVGLLPRPEENELLRQIYRLPYVWMMGKLPNAHGDHCNFDQEAAGRMAAEHLMAKGHSQVAFLNPKPGHAQFENIKRAFCEAVRNGGHHPEVLEPSAPPRLQWPLPAVSAQSVVDGLIREWESIAVRKRPTALAVGADTTAVQMYSALQRRGFRPGSDVGVISCNDERSLVLGLDPALTTVNVRAEAVGRSAVARLLWRIAHPGDTATARLLVEPVLSERNSVPQR